MTKLESLGQRIGLIRLLPFANKLLILTIKVPILWLLDKISKWFPFPNYKGNSQVQSFINKEALNELEKTYKRDIIDRRLTWAGVYRYKVDASDRAKIDNGDMCLFSGLLSGYLINIDGDVKPFKEYINTFIESQKDGSYVLLRGPTSAYYLKRDDPSGDQLVGMVHAVSEYKKKTGVIHPRFQSLVDQIIKDGYRLRQLDGSTPLHGNLSPGILLEGGSASIILATLAVAERWNEFDYLYNDCGYKYLLEYASPWIKWWRAWYSDNVAILALSVLNYETWEKYYKNKKIGDGSCIRNITSAIHNILSKNKWNLWLWLLTLDNSQPASPKLKQGIEYFKTFNPVSYSPDSKGYWPLYAQNCDWVWQRNPFKKEASTNSSYGRLDFLYTKGLLDKHRIKY